MKRPAAGLLIILCVFSGFFNARAQVIYGQATKDNEQYDFKPGEKIIFEDDFSQDSVGKFPRKWRLYPTISTLDIGDSITNTGVYPIKKETADSFNYSYVAIASDNHYFPIKPKLGAQNYLPDTFTLELYFRMDNDQSDAAVVFFNEDGVNIFETRCMGTGEFVSMHMHTTRYSVDYPGSFDHTTWHHLAFYYRHRSIALYVDNYKLMVLPDCKTPPANFIIAGNSYTEGNPKVDFTKIRLAGFNSKSVFNAIITEKKFTTHAIYFKTAQSAIEPESAAFVQELADWMKSNPGISLAIHGYTDNEGEPKTNLKLSQDRANAVKAALEALGVDAIRLTANGFGEADPIDTNDTPEGRAQNRRVEFVSVNRN